MSRQNLSPNHTSLFSAVIVKIKLRRICAGMASQGTIHQLTRSPIRYSIRLKISRNFISDKLRHSSDKGSPFFVEGEFSPDLCKFGPKILPRQTSKSPILCRCSNFVLVFFISAKLGIFKIWSIFSNVRVFFSSSAREKV